MIKRMIECYFPFRRPVAGDRGGQQVHRNLGRHQPPRGRVAGGNPVPDPAQAIFHGKDPAQERVCQSRLYHGRGQAQRGQVPRLRRMQGKRDPQENFEEGLFQVQVVRQPPRPLKKAFSRFFLNFG
ncbi:uncharacterized protein TNIN_368101 [Trichonephila inaurata madagascariensis]|uniref:Uncharacterized protein n=1 Tax=Trichonephila inaurata madagascariensis TaxID=2747483 RepID=A0A8X6KMG8_9ARAC|nr:uncharacterized protein TNIN_368101 [Trichonephila inaurata madagascariensis]